MSEASGTVPSPITAGILGRCPHCGKGRLFQGFLSVAPGCSECGLEYDFVDSGDGPAVFVILIVGMIVVGGALWLEIAARPPLWVHAALWIPLTLILSVGSLRPLKGIFVAQQHRRRAAEGRLASAAKS